MSKQSLQSNMANFFRSAEEIRKSMPILNKHALSMGMNIYMGRPCWIVPFGPACVNRSKANNSIGRSCHLLVKKASPQASLLQARTVTWQQHRGRLQVWTVMGNILANIFTLLPTTNSFSSKKLGKYDELPTIEVEASPEESLGDRRRRLWREYFKTKDPDIARGRLEFLLTLDAQAHAEYEESFVKRARTMCKQ